jgi:uncharacterized protein with ParB-like and HNH nuclease domain
MSKYAVQQQPVETLLTWIKSGEIAIPEIQRPFVWKAAKVRDAWCSPKGHLKNRNKNTEHPSLTQQHDDK